MLQNESSEILGTTEKAAKVLGSTREGLRKPLVVPGNNLCMNIIIYLVFLSMYLYSCGSSVSTRWWYC